jgi:hypothetical protein
MTTKNLRDAASQVAVQEVMIFIIIPAVNPAQFRQARITQQPIARPTFRCLPERVSGIPMAREIFPFAEEMPSARFQENENPYFFPIAV